MGAGASIACVNGLSALMRVGVYTECVSGSRSVKSALRRVRVCLSALRDIGVYTECLKGRRSVLSALRGV